MEGKIVSHYEIMGKLGGGGMGVVYKARDTKLDRFVALKFLPSYFSFDEKAKQRFIQEAKAASALDHPNICNIHEIDETADHQLFIVMACYQGKTLREKLEKGPLPAAKVIDISIQIAQGLKCAHEKGILHRDIKPANIIVTDKDEIKIVDFGLAKLAGQIRLTKDVSTLGTVTYMSPEQCRGDESDHHTDIWSLGVVMYEMLTGQPPFKGEYEQAVMYSILNDNPVPVRKIRSSVSEELERIIDKALVKNPDGRYSRIDDMLSDLKAIKDIPFHAAGRKLPRRLSRQILILPVLVLLAVLTVIFYFSTQTGEQKEYKIQHTSPMTTAQGLEQDPTWSPEGTRIAYSSDESGNMDIWVKQIEAGQKINLSEDNPGYDGKPAWSPDGEWIAFVSDRGGGGIYKIPALGGIPKQIIPIEFAKSLSRIGTIPDISWSPDGSELVYAVSGNLFTISSSGSNPHEVLLPPTGLIVGYSEPDWSPDGEHIICTGFVAEGISTSQIWSLPCSGTYPLPVTEGRHMDHSPVWAPNGKHIFFISDRGGSNDIWSLPVQNNGSPAGKASPLTAGAGVNNIAISKDGAKLVYTKTVDRSNIWSIPIDANRRLTLSDALRITSENNYIENLDVSPDGEWIAFDSNRRGNMDIWIMRKDASELRQLTTNKAHDWYPKWSPDGKKILFHSMRSGNRDLYIMPVSGGAVMQLTNHPAEDLAGDWSPDEKYISFSSNRSGNMDAWIIPGNGGVPQQLTFDEAADIALIWAPEGDQVVFSTNRTGYYELFLMRTRLFPKADDKAEQTQLTKDHWVYISALFWNKDKQIIYSYGVGGKFNQGTNLWMVSANDGSAQPILDLNDCLMEPSHSLSSDGERIYFPLWERIGDIWLAELSADI